MFVFDVSLLSYILFLSSISNISFLVETIKTTMNILHRFSAGFFSVLASAQGVSASGFPEEWGKVKLREIAQTCETMLLKGVSPLLYPLSFALPSLLFFFFSLHSLPPPSSSSPFLPPYDKPLVTNLTGDFPHDATLAAAMLMVVVSNILCSIATDPLHENLEFVNYWISQITLKPFPKLAMCYAFLAKLSTEVLRGVVVEGESLLIALFPIVCGLLDGCVNNSTAT